MRIFDNLIFHHAVDVVGIFDSQFNQLFTGARPMRAQVRPDTRLMDHPIEVGSLITDHRILLPIEIELSMILRREDYIDTYRAIRQYWENTTLLIIQTKAGVYRDQVICSIPHLEESELYDVLQLAFTTRQIQFAGSKAISKPANPANSDTTDRGYIQPTNSSPAQGSARYETAGGVFR